jgi:hypothetical protein
MIHEICSLSSERTPSTRPQGWSHESQQTTGLVADRDQHGYLRTGEEQRTRKRLSSHQHVGQILEVYRSMLMRCSCNHDEYERRLVEKDEQLLP